MWAVWARFHNSIQQQLCNRAMNRLQSSAKNITEITQKSAAGSGPGPDLVSVCAGSGKLAEKSVNQTELNEIPISAYAAVRQ